MAKAQPAANGAAGSDEQNPLNKTHAAAEHAALIQSRETGVVLPDDDLRSGGKVKALPFAKSWVHMLAGGCVVVVP